MSERLTDERVREIAEDGEVYIEPLAESDFGRGVGHENWPSKEAAALAREVLAARAGYREEREGRRFVSGKQVMRYYVRGHEDSCPACGCPNSFAEQYVGWFEDRAAPGGETRKEANDG